MLQLIVNIPPTIKRNILMPVYSLKYTPPSIIKIKPIINTITHATVLTVLIDHEESALVSSGLSGSY